MVLESRNTGLVVVSQGKLPRIQTHITDRFVTRKPNRCKTITESDSDDSNYVQDEVISDDGGGKMDSPLVLDEFNGVSAKVYIGN